MTAPDVTVLRRPRRRTHLATPTGTHAATWCGLTVPTADATGVPLSLAGGETTRLVTDLRRELDETTCLRCTRIALAIVTMHTCRMAVHS